MEYGLNIFFPLLLFVLMMYFFEISSKRVTAFSLFALGLLFVITDIRRDYLDFQETICNTHAEMKAKNSDYHNFETDQFCKTDEQGLTNKRR